MYFIVIRFSSLQLVLLLQKHDINTSRARFLFNKKKTPLVCCSILRA